MLKNYYSGSLFFTSSLGALGRRFESCRPDSHCRDSQQYQKSGRVYLMLEPPNLPTLAEKISANIQFRRKNIIRKNR